MGGLEGERVIGGARQSRRASSNAWAAAPPLSRHYHHHYRSIRPPPTHMLVLKVGCAHQVQSELLQRLQLLTAVQLLRGPHSGEGDGQVICHHPA